jgi:hypothetical protein
MPVTRGTNPPAKSDTGCFGVIPRREYEEGAGFPRDDGLGAAGESKASGGDRGGRDAKTEADHVPITYLQGGLTHRA